MAIKKKTFTLKFVFFRYLLTLAIAFFILAAVLIFITDLGVKNGFLIPANYSENLARQAKPFLVSQSEIKEDMIPEGCKYIVFDKNFKVIKTDLEKQDIKEATDYAKGLINVNSSKKNYYFIEREDGSCVLQYDIQMRYYSKWLNQHFLKPQVFIIIILFVGCLVSVVIVSIVFAKNLKNHLSTLMEATEKIKEHDLDFEVRYSSIGEFNEVISSINEMKCELKQSLKQQWSLEQAKREQISSLAHDIKTPLTVIKGNAELLADSSLNSEQQEYIGFIEKNSSQIEKYIKMLIDMSKVKAKYIVELHKINTKKFVNDIYNQLVALSLPKQLKIIMEEGELPENIVIDRENLYRAMLNIISNAVDYSPVNSEIYFMVMSEEDFIEFCIIDNGKGFSDEALKSATEQFYMEDRGRTSKEHYGMGLYIADSIVKQHNGILIITNSKKLGGAQVIIRIPIK